MSDNIPQLPDDDEPMTWESTPTPFYEAIDSVIKAHKEALLPQGAIHMTLALLYVQLAQTAELRRIASAVERIANQKAK